MALPTSTQELDVPWMSNLHGFIHFQSHHPDSTCGALDWSPAHQQAYDAIKDTINTGTPGAAQAVSATQEQHCQSTQPQLWEASGNTVVEWSRHLPRRTFT